MSDSNIDLQLDKETIIDYLQKFDLLTTKVKKLDPILNFEVPLFKLTQDLSVSKSKIETTGSNVIELSGIEKILNRL